MVSERYEIEVFGGCLGEWLPDGTRLVANPSEDPRPLDLVHVTIRDGDGPWARFIRATADSFDGACKIFLGWRGEGEGRVLLVGQLAPPVAAIISEREIVSVHRIVGRVGASGEMTAVDKAALALIAPFAMSDVKPAAKEAARSKPRRKRLDEH